MINTNMNTAQAYYMAMSNKNFDEMASYLHSEVHFTGPLSTMNGKEAVVQAAKAFAMFLKEIKIQEKFATEDKVMLASDFVCPEPIGAFRAASLLSFHDGLISRIELFYDARPFVSKKEEIFNQN